MVKDCGLDSLRLEDLCAAYAHNTNTRPFLLGKVNLGAISLMRPGLSNADNWPNVPICFAGLEDRPRQYDFDLNDVI